MTDSIDSNQIRAEMIAREIRIQQSVEIQRSIPSQVIGNLAVAAIFLFFFPAVGVSSGAVYALVPLIAVNALAAQSYLRLRNQTRPKNVSLRRIRVIGINSLIAGLSWAAFSILAVRSGDSTVTLLVVTGTVAFAFSSLVSMSSFPNAGLFAAIPILIANGFATWFYGFLPVWPSIFAFGAMSFTAVSCAMANWQKTKINVAAQVDYALAETERAKTMEAVSKRLSKYLSPQLFEEILKGRQTDAIVSKRKKLTVFFSDIVGFTELTESLESEELAALLNRYLTEMTDIAEQHGGTVDKFIGDAVVVYFGDPYSKGAKRDAEACVNMALAMKDRVHTLKKEWVDLGFLDGFDLRIGINTGYCNVGNFGSNQRVDYTLIGNEVNLAARLESAAGTGGVLLSGKTFALVKDVVTAKEREPLSVKGFARPVRTFEVQKIATGTGVEASTVHVEELNFSLTLNSMKLSPMERDRYAAILQEALDQLDH